MTAFFDARCSKCGRRFGWCGEIAERPPCPQCGDTGNRAQQAKDAEAVRKALTEADPQDVARGELDDLLKVESGLSDWEITFVEDLDAKRDRYRFSDKQIAKLHQVWDRVCG